MVTYELTKRSGKKLVYEYWPENDRGSEPGTIAVDLDEETISLEKPAARDFQCRTTGAEMNTLRDSINQMRLECGEPPLTEEELPTEPEDTVFKWWLYYDHASRDISRRHDDGLMPEHGMAAWY